MSILDIIKEEEKTIEDSLYNFKEETINSYELIINLSHILRVKSSQYGVFYFLSNQVENGLNQSLLSALRRHGVQAEIMLRHSIEAACLMSYSLYNNRHENFIIGDAQGALPIKGVEKKAYKYLDEKFPEESSVLKGIKNEINQFYAHGNLFNSFKTVSTEHKEIKYIDQENHFMEKTFIWKIGYVTCNIYNMLIKAGHECEYIVIDNNVYSKIRVLFEGNQKLRKQYMQSEKYKSFDIG